MKNENQTAPATPVLTWDQALFSFCFVKYIPVGKAKRKENQVFHPLLIDWHLPNQPTKSASVTCHFSMQIFHTWENVDSLTWKIAFTF